MLFDYYLSILYTLEKKKKKNKTVKQIGKGAVRTRHSDFTLSDFEW